MKKMRRVVSLAKKCKDMQGASFADARESRSGLDICIMGSMQTPEVWAATFHRKSVRAKTRALFVVELRVGSRRLDVARD